ncbi:MAG: twin-arginine translocase TatA/TatE family subunit [Acidobacteriia bacterium]|nr:twin-arginine translocase TatA/TatE family subunit [Terriglobia bacterium]
MGEGLFQPMHLLVILVIAVFIFGPKKLPELGKGLGEGIKGFKDAFSGGLSSEDTKVKEVPKEIEEKSSVEK